MKTGDVRFQWIGAVLSAAVLIFLVTVPVPAQDPEKVLRQAHAALGDRGTLAGLRTLRAQGDLLKTGSRLTGDVRIDYRTPADFAFSGELDPDAGGRRRWLATPRDTAEILSDAEGAAAVSALDPALVLAVRHSIPPALPLFHETPGTTPAIDRLDILGNRTFYPVTIDDRHGVYEWYAVDAAAGDILRWEGRDGERLLLAVDYRDFRPVEGLRLPFEIEISGPNGRLLLLKIRFWRVNPELPDDTFIPGSLSR